MASVNTQKTDPVMEPKLKAVNWDKVSGHGTGRGGDWGSWGRAGGLRAVAVHDEGDEGPRGRRRQLLSLTWGSKLGPWWRWVPGNQMQGLAAKTPEGGPPQGSLKLRRGRHAQLDQCRGGAATGRRRDGAGAVRIRWVQSPATHLSRRSGTSIRPWLGAPVCWSGGRGGAGWSPVVVEPRRAGWRCLGRRREAGWVHVPPACFVGLAHCYVAISSWNRRKGLRP